MTQVFDQVPHPRRELVARVLTLGLLLGLVMLLARTYIGHSSSPYGVCYAASSRAIPCALVASGRPSARPHSER